MKFVTINYKPRKLTLFGVEIGNFVYFYGLWSWINE